MKCLIIEDEKPAQRVLKQYVERIPDLELVGIHRSALDAQSCLLSGNTDLLFLDINLPVISGIALLKTLKNPPLVIITTAYSEYALEGFELDVVDYLLKPFSFERFLKSVHKAIRLNQQTEAVSFSAESQSVVNKQIIINVDKVLHQLKPAEILYIKSDKDYVCFHTTTRKFMFIDSLKSWEEKLSDVGFARIHKSYLVNLEHVERVEGNMVHVQEEQLPIGRSYRSQFLSAFSG